MPYGSYVIDLTQPEEALWKNVDKGVRNEISQARKKGVTVRSGPEFCDAAYSLIAETFARTKVRFMGREPFMRYVDGLGGNAMILEASCEGAPQSYMVLAFSRHSAYSVYVGNVAGQQRGASKLLYWESIRLCRELGVRRYDFVGARINPEKGSKQANINFLKKHLGGNLIEGYMWKYSLRPLRSIPYNLAVRLLKGGDIVDRERNKLCRE